MRILDELHGYVQFARPCASERPTSPAAVLGGIRNFTRYDNRNAMMSRNRYRATNYSTIGEYGQKGIDRR